MNNSNIEAWALAIANSVRNGGRVEDDRVEIKYEWPLPEQAARRIAAHCNASRGEAVLWLLGLDEKTGRADIIPPEPADWFAQVKACFDAIAPSFVHLIIPYGDGSFAAVLWNTERAPFVVKNPAHGKRDGGAISFEVPWRAGTSTRSARREELLQLLVPATRLPECEILEGSIDVQWRSRAPHNPGDEEYRGWNLWLSLYVIPRTPEPVVIPFHRCRADLAIEPAMAITNAGELYAWSDMTHIPGDQNTPTRIHSLTPTVHCTPTEVIFGGPGRIRMGMGWRTGKDVSAAVRPSVALSLHVVGAGKPLIVVPTFGPADSSLTGDGLAVLTWSVTGLSAP